MTLSRASALAAPDSSSPGPGGEPGIVLYDLVLTGGEVLDPGHSLSGRLDVAIRDGKIAAVAASLPPHRAHRTIDVAGRLVCPGFIDFHAHVFAEYGLPADEVGVGSGVTTLVDQGSSGIFTFPRLQAEVVARARTDVRAFLLVNQDRPRCAEKTSEVREPSLLDAGPLVELARQAPATIRGFKVHAESGTLSRWGMRAVALAREAGDAAGLPLYIHTGELFPVTEERRPHPSTVARDVLSYTRAGDVLGHCYSPQPDGLMGARASLSPWLLEALASGVLLEVGHGRNFSFAVAEAMMREGVVAHIISSDVNTGALQPNGGPLLYNLFDTLSKMVALGVPLSTAIAAVTINPARVLRAQHEIGDLSPGSRADITVLNSIGGQFVFHDSLGQSRSSSLRLAPHLVIRAGCPLPHGEWQAVARHDAR